jgi:hypothetical protein
MEINTEECDFCSGVGYVPGKITVENLDAVEYNLIGKKIKVPGEREKKVYYNFLCPKCNGTGKTDWVSKVTGSWSNDIPTPEELTEEVCALMKEDNIFGTEKIVIKDHRKKMWEEFVEEEKKKLKEK